MSRSGDRNRAGHGKNSGMKHREGRQSSNSSSNSDSSERQIRGSRREASDASTDTCKNSHSEAGEAHYKVSKSEHPTKPQIQSKPIPPKPIPEVPRTVDTLTIPCEKLKLLNLVWDLDFALRSLCKCVVRFDKQAHTVILEGAIGDITAAKILLHEVAVASVTQRIDVTPQIQGLLSTDKGENWLTEDFRELGVAAVVYVKDGTAYLIARDRDTLISAENLVQLLVSTQGISFDDCHVCFLRSTSWSQQVQALEAPCLISVHADYSAKKIEVAGRASDVDLCASEILELLKKNRTITRIIKHTIGVVRLLKKQESAINKDIYQGGRYESDS